eukprot:scaffold84358_cov64-Phaeocystis_antarctica.AAC.1
MTAHEARLRRAAPRRPGAATPMPTPPPRCRARVCPAQRGLGLDPEQLSCRVISAIRPPRPILAIIHHHPHRPTPSAVGAAPGAACAVRGSCCCPSTPPSLLSPRLAVRSAKVSGRSAKAFAARRCARAQRAVYAFEGELFGLLAQGHDNLFNLVAIQTTLHVEGVDHTEEILVLQPILRPLRVTLHGAHTANHLDKAGQVHLRWRHTVDRRRVFYREGKYLVVLVRCERTLEGVAEVLLGALVKDAPLRLKGTLHELRAHGDVALGVVDDPQDERFEIWPPRDHLESRVLRPCAQDELTLARVVDERPRVGVELDRLHVKLDQFGVSAHPNEMYLPRLAQVHDGGDGRRDADARGDRYELVVSRGRREGRRKGAIDPSRACTRLGERGMNLLRPVAHGCHAHARVVWQGRVLDEREGVPLRLRYPRQADVHVARTV